MLTVRMNKEHDIHSFAIDKRNNYHNPDIVILFCARQLIRKWDFPNLAAPFWRIYYNGTHGASIIRNGHETPLLPGRFYLISPDTEYGARLKTPFDHFYVHFQAAPPYASCTGRVYTYDAAGRDREVMTKINELNYDLQENARAISLLIHELCIRALQQVPAGDLSQSCSDRRILKAVDFIEGNLSRPISNQELAAPFGMNVNSFARLFRERTGLSPQAYIAQRRIQEACLLLRFTNLSIDEIAEQTGFCDRYYFTRIFSGQRRISPAAFRKLNH